jgi:RTX calcium-binding nonapeptide repeat (4 copies)
MFRSSCLLALSLFCATELRAEQTTRFGYHLHTWPETGYTRFSQMLSTSAIAGGKSARLDTNWASFQSAPKTKFNPQSAKLKPAAYTQYLFDRGYGENGVNLFEAYLDLHQSYTAHQKLIFNFGVIPDWARQPAANFKNWKVGVNQEFSFHPTAEQTNFLVENSLSNTDYVGQLLADLIVYISKQPDGRATLENIGGWEIFNEAGGVYGTGIPPEAGSNNGADAWPRLPYEEYLSVVDNALARVHNAYNSIGLKNGPPLIAPPVGGTFNPEFWQAIADYKPKNASSKNASGYLMLDQIGLHPYGLNVQAWHEPSTYYHKSIEDGPNDVRDNLSYGRILMPTDDRFTWESLIERAKSTELSSRIYSYASRNNNADQFFDENTEMGVTRTMARFAQMGYGKISMNFSEWGASSFVGDTTKSDFFAQLNTAFIDPIKYGDVPLGFTLPQEMVETTQTENIVQTLGLMRNWDFVNTATIYEMFDRLANGATDSEQYLYGLALSKLKDDGQPNWKPAGLAYIAFMRGREYHNVRPEGQKGVDIHISAASGALDENQINPNAHNLILFNDSQNHTIATGIGDDIIFGGNGDDFISGGQGHNRLYGGFGNDIIVGGNENDKINGGTGDDLLTGGGGKNQYLFSAYSELGSGFDGNDTITDFRPNDILQIVGGFSFEKLQMKNTSEGGVKGVKINYASNGATIFLQGFTQENLKQENFRIFEADSQSAQKQ